MRILWLCNIMLPKIAEARNQKQDAYGGWLTGLSNSLIINNEIALSVCFPERDINNVEAGSVGKLEYYAFPQCSYNNPRGRFKLESCLKEIVLRSKPDVINIHGTEFPHALAMTTICQKLGLLNKVVVSIQGLVSVCAKHYESGLPNSVAHGHTIKELIRNNNIRKGREVFARKGELEEQTIRNVKHVIGRTDWDRACIAQINPDAMYHFCNETLRDSFYEHSWDILKCKKYSIFISQAGYPIKGFHWMLEAMPEVIKHFPDSHIYVAGSDITKYDTLSDKLRIGSYGQYIRFLIRKYNLKDNVTFLGALNETDMCTQYLSSNVFVSASSIENESNSISEAKILGVPVVASFVGGVTNRITHGYDGLIYQHDSPYMLSYYIKKIFEDKGLSENLSRAARLHAKQANDRDSNLNATIKIYDEIHR